MNRKRQKRGAERNSSSRRRCPWAKTEPMIAYHDDEWGVPLHGDRSLFELLILEGAQAGLSWETILRKRARYRALFCDFEPVTVARFTQSRIDRLMRDPGIVRNRAKIEAAVANARALLLVHDEFGSFDEYVWQFVGGKPILNRRRSMQEVPASTRESAAMSAGLRKRGFRFVGPTICYAFMQAAGMVNDHLLSCAWRLRS
ncbi:MAG TPA: DNA-3-methyladenine glycosylase I [Candidatus Babeliales bacterium]|nr:DNA-3-methyladenine glycosylase I [Candidatus Babeliales bacterium]